MKKMFITIAAMFALLSAAVPATAQAPRKIALVAAVGDVFTLVRLRESTGSNIIDNYTRRTIKMPGNALNMSVLKGLDRQIGAAHPDSERVFIALNAAELDGVLPQNREKVAIGKIVAELEKRPDRKDWDKIIVATPKYLFSEREGMGPKLHGLGIYIRPNLGANSIDDQEGFSQIDLGGVGEEDTINPGDKSKSPSKEYVAPYSYITVYVLDPKTMTVIEKNARHDFQKLYDRQSTALDIAKNLPLDMLAERAVSLAERSAARAVGETEYGVSVNIKDVPQTPVAAPPAEKK